jgi:transcriptional regulator GlxA family with amidase domain
MREKTIVIVAAPNGLSLDIIGPAEVFTVTNSFKNAEPPDIGFGGYKVIIASASRDKAIMTSTGATIVCSTTVYEICEQIDTLIIGGFSLDFNWKNCPELIEWTKKQLGNVRRIASVCIGAFVLAEAGLLEGKRATTHWEFARQLQKSYETTRVDSDPIYIKDGNIYTSAGAASGIDLALALIEEDCGHDISLKVAQRLVLYLRRPGNQSQFSNLLLQQVSSKKPIQEIQQWILSNLKGNLNVEVLAEKVSMSPRNFARVFLTETGNSPAKYVENARLESSKRYLEESALSQDEIAQKCGFGSADTLRKVFLRKMGITPSHYKNLFGNNNFK